MAAKADASRKDEDEETFDTQSRGFGKLVSTIVGNTDKLSKIKLPGGLVGKVTRVLIAIACSFAAICWAVRGSEDVAKTAIIALAVVTLASFAMLLAFAAKHPQAALLEGAEFLMHERIQRIGMKGGSMAPVEPELSVIAHEPPLDVPKIAELASQPDPVPSPNPETLKPKTPGSQTDGKKS